MAKDTEQPFIMVVSGSTQKEGQSHKIAGYIGNCLKGRGASARVVNLHELNPPYFGHHQDPAWQARWRAVEEDLAKVDGLVLVSPEYNGSASPGLYSFMYYVGDHLAHKPVLPVGVSAGRGGAYPLANLRQNGFKDPGYVMVPADVIVSHVHRLFDDVAAAGPLAGVSEEEREVRLRIERALDVLLAYAAALAGLKLPEEGQA
ncbi:NAD(P)H-dependent oxidoreductase [Candidatus Saccharibacteria bacterium]|nr:NAD(P)H-dependent oxidoreductase [Candidatus Saccharibacteria bacterium]